VGLFDVITGRRKLAKPAPDRLFALSTAYVPLQAELGLRSRGRAGIVFQALETADFEQVVRDMEEVVRATGADSGTTVESRNDSYGYRWMVLSDEDFDNLVVGINAVSSALEEGGYGERILCAVFAFADAQDHPLYLIYNYKRGAFYPFAPASAGEPGGPSEQARDSERELRVKPRLAAELPVEPELERWFPLWGIPI
jgi:hypothetical protein